MSIDQKKVKEFWDSRGKQLNKVPFDSITNLEENPELMKLKIKLEQEKVLGLIPFNKKMKLLDLGAGIGNWSMFFANKVDYVYAVEYSEELIKLGKERIEKLGINNIKFVHAPAQEFLNNTKFDVIFISGLFVYMNDDECKELLMNIPSYSKEKTFIILRDGTGINGRYEINNKYSDNLKTYYSAIYRTRETYIKYFEDIGSKLLKDENMFSGDSILNKYPETRLRIYLFTFENIK